MDAEIPGVTKVYTQKIVPKAEGKLFEGKEMPSAPIGVFDSGVGGLTVLKEISRELPSEDIIYLADTARVPFGGRPVNELIKINHEIIRFLLSQGVKLIVMACGTSSAVAYKEIKDNYKVPMVEMIGPGSRAAIKGSKNGKIGVMATIATVESGAYVRAIKNLKKEVRILQVGCPLFVPLIEDGLIDAEETKSVAKEYLRPLLDAKVDTIILGCTHYPHLLGVLKELAPNVTFIDPALEVAKETKKVLAKLKLQSLTTRKPEYEYFVTGPVTSFQELGSKLFGKTLAGVKRATL